MVRPGQIFKSRYRISRELGSGGMGVVFEASDLLRGGHPCALKLLKSHHERNLASRRRFCEESALMARLDHPNIVRVYDSSTLQDAMSGSDEPLYIVMELLSGESFREWLRRGEQFQLSEIIALIDQVLSALESAHVLNIIHRDLKPDNLFLTHDEAGRYMVKVLDFGIAKDLERETSLTSSLNQSILGTPDYVSPEQVMGNRVHPSSDLYSIGVILYRLIQGDPVFSLDHPELSPQMRSLPKHFQIAWLQSNATPPSLGFEPELDAIIAHLLMKSPEDRRFNANSLRNTLRRWVANNPIIATTPVPHAHRPSPLSTLADLPMLDPILLEDFEEGEMSFNPSSDRADLGSGISPDMSATIPPSLHEFYRAIQRSNAESDLDHTDSDDD